MSSAKEKVLEMVASGKISPSQGDELLAAMAPAGPSIWQILFHPAARLGLGPSLAIGAIASLGALVLTRFGVSFDGALDAHSASVSVPMALVQVALYWPLVALVFWLAAKLAGKSTRLVDHLAAVGIARLPYTLLGLTVLPLRSLDPSRPLAFSPLQAVAIFTGLPLLVWSVALLCTGFRAVSGLRGGRLALTLVIAVLVAEVISKVLLALIPL